ncbi:hypothetical protein D3C71_1164600 [compost metagenome]
MCVFFIGHGRIRNRNRRHPRRFRRRDTERRILEHQAILRCDTQTPRCGQEDIRRRFGRADFRVIGGDDEVEHSEPIAVQRGFLAERLTRRTGAHRNGNVVSLQMPDQFLCARHRLCCRKTLAHQRFADQQKLFGCNRQFQRLDHITCEVTSTATDDVLLEAPVEGPPVTPGNDRRHFGVNALGIQQQAVHIENHGLDRAELIQRCIHRI